MISTTIPAPPSDAPNLEPTRTFFELSGTDRAYAGGKGADLGQLTRIGLPVPAGFVVGAPALRRAAEGRGATPEADLPGWLANAIVAGHEKLVGGRAAVAVRSSPTAPDSATTKFTAMSETFLNVRGHDKVLAAVGHCWRSRREADIAVIVQRQVLSTRAGLMFTVDPLDGNRDQLVIEGYFGLGATLGSSWVSPDRFVVDKVHMTVLTRAIRPQELVIEPDEAGGTQTRELTPAEGQRASLSDDEVLRLAELGIAIEREQGCAQGTEWAFDPEGAIWMLRSSPIDAGA
jgi:phosphoenolpyruvate synthase/pyruvate phosphate dikinase